MSLNIELVTWYHIHLKQDVLSKLEFGLNNRKDFVTKYILDIIHDLDLPIQNRVNIPKVMNITNDDNDKIYVYLTSEIYTLLLELLNHKDNRNITSLLLEEIVIKDNRYLPIIIKFKRN